MRHIRVVITLAAALAGTIAAQQSTYVLTAPNWGPEQSVAVTRAGGAVSFSHARPGVGVVTSSTPGFLKAALSSGAFTSGAPDQIVNWVEPHPDTPIVSAEAVTPGDETFINFQWNMQAIEAPAAWALGFTGQGVRVAIVDGGLWDQHVDLTGAVDTARSKSFVPGFAFNQDVGTFWHATHVAGIVAARDNGIGVIGVAPSATLIGVKVLHNGSGAFSAVLEGIYYAATPISEGGAGADIINMSLGATFARGGGNTGAGPLIAAVNAAVNYAESRNVLVVSSAGNNALDLDHSGSIITVPAMSGSGIAVSATGPVGFAVGYPNGATNFRRPASYTNYGVSLVNVAAPGGDAVYAGTGTCAVPIVPSGSITAPCWVWDMVFSLARGTSNASYTWADGTSMAAPAASGVAALIKQRFPLISVGELKARLANSADDEGKKGRDPYYGAGFVNARRAVQQ